MRLISSDGKTDVPYEQVGLAVSVRVLAGKNVYGIIAHFLSGDHFVKMGEYEDMNRANDVMQEVVGAYVTYGTYFRFPSE